MKNWRQEILRMLETRLMILLEYEPGDAMQDGYFRHLDELRDALKGNAVRYAETREAEAFPLLGRAIPA